MYTVIVGPTCSGKNSMLNDLVKKGYERVVTFTTRPKRPNERDGIDYIFISNHLFQMMIGANLFTEYDFYETPDGIYWYGSVLELESSKKRAVILSPKAAFTLKGHPNVTVIYIDSPEDVRLERGIARGDTRVNLEARIREEKPIFEAFKASGAFDMRIAYQGA